MDNRGPLDIYCYRFIAKKRPIAAAAFAATDRLHWVSMLSPSRRSYAEARSRADEALLTATRKPRLRWLFEVRLALLAAQYNATRQFFETRRDAVAVTWNGLVSDRRIFMLAARDAGAKTLFLERGPFPQTITADPVGVNHNNGLPRDGALFRRWLSATPSASGAWRTLADRLQQRLPRVTRESDLTRLPPLNTPFIFVPLQKQSDTQLRLFGVECRGVAETIDLLARAALSLPEGWHIRLKEHPSDANRAESVLRRYEGLPLYLDNSTDTFVQVRASRLVVTVNSSVGLEAMLLEKPVVAMGLAFWAIPGLAEAATSDEALRRVFAAPDLIGFEPDLRDAFLSFLVANYYIGTESGPDGQFSIPDAGWQRLRRRVMAGQLDLSEISSGETP
jgi:capsular polysaccharide export protein